MKYEGNAALQQPQNDLRTAAEHLTPRIKELVQNLYSIQGRLFAPVPMPDSAPKQEGTNVVDFELPPLDPSIGSAHRHLDDAFEVVKMISDRL